MKSKRNFQKAVDSSSESVQLFETVLEIFVACIFGFFFLSYRNIELVTNNVAVGL